MGPHRAGFVVDAGHRSPRGDLRRRFLVPLVFAVWAFEREEYRSYPDGQPTALSIARLVAAFAIGGLLGVTLAALIRRSSSTASLASSGSRCGRH